MLEEQRRARLTDRNEKDRERRANFVGETEESKAGGTEESKAQKRIEREAEQSLLEEQRNRGKQGSLKEMRRIEREGEQSLLEEQRKARLTERNKKDREGRRAKFAGGTEESKAH